MSCSRETCFSAFSWSRAPTKSRLMSSLPPLRHDRSAAKKRRGGHPRPGGHYCSAEYTSRPPERRTIVGSHPCRGWLLELSGGPLIRRPHNGGIIERSAAAV